MKNFYLYPKRQSTTAYFVLAYRLNYLPSDYGRKILIFMNYLIGIMNYFKIVLWGGRFFLILDVN